MAIDSLLDLVRAALPFVQEDVSSPASVILRNISEYVHGSLSLFGLKFHSEVSSSAGSQDALQLEQVLDTLGQYRSEIRKALRSKDLDKQMLYKLSDDLRDNKLPSIGISLEDSSLEGSFDIRVMSLAERNQRKAEESRGRETSKVDNTGCKPIASVSLEDLVPPSDFFRQETNKYSNFDAQGLPTHDHEGSELTKTKKKKLLKTLERYKRKYDAVQSRLDSGS